MIVVITVVITVVIAVVIAVIVAVVTVVIIAVIAIIVVVISTGGGATGRGTSLAFQLPIQNGAGLGVNLKVIPVVSVDDGTFVYGAPVIAVHFVHGGLAAAGLVHGNFIGLAGADQAALRGGTGARYRPGAVGCRGNRLIVGLCVPLQEAASGGIHLKFIPDVSACDFALKNHPAVVGVLVQGDQRPPGNTRQGQGLHAGQGLRSGGLRGGVQQVALRHGAGLGVHGRHTAEAGGGEGHFIAAEAVVGIQPHKVHGGIGIHGLHLGLGVFLAQGNRCAAIVVALLVFHALELLGGGINQNFHKLLAAVHPIFKGREPVLLLLGNQHGAFGHQRLGQGRGVAFSQGGDSEHRGGQQGTEKSFHENQLLILHSLKDTDEFSGATLTGTLAQSMSSCSHWRISPVWASNSNSYS